MAFVWQIGIRPHIHSRNLGRRRFKGMSPSVRAPTNPVLIVLFMAAFVLWSRHIGLFTSFSNFSSGSFAISNSTSPANLFSYGTINVENDLQYEGERTGFYIENGNKDDEDEEDISTRHPAGQKSVDMPQNNSNTSHSEGLHNSEREHWSWSESKDDNSGTALSVPRKEKLQFKQNDAKDEAMSPNSALKSELTLREFLNFNKKTAINFMHFHKTGGVTFKISLHNFYSGKRKGNGDAVLVQDACYVREGVSIDILQPSFKVWRCDWDPIQEMNEEDRNKHDFVFGHQFGGNGIGELLNNRDLRTFTILRHPFDRKVSFYYHFFVREVERKEQDVSFEEIRDFLLYDKLVIDADLGRDLGPNYMAGRLLSDGREGFVGNSSFSYYAVEQGKKEIVAEQAIELIRKYVFVGLQGESLASQCMLRKVVEAFNEVNDVSNDGVGKIDEKLDRLNRGSYSLSAKDIWSRFSPQERGIFDMKEKVDLRIYSEGKRLFQKHVRIFGCAHRLVESL